MNFALHIIMSVKMVFSMGSSGEILFHQLETKRKISFY